MVKVVIKYFNRLSYLLYNMECAEITNASLNLNFVVQTILVENNTFKELQNHDCIIKMILAIIFLLDDTTFVKDKVSVSSRYFISNVIDQNLLVYISAYISKLIDFMKNDSVVDDNIFKKDEIRKLHLKIAQINEYHKY